MRIGLPREIKDGESRVALTPAGVSALVRRSQEVVFQAGLGMGVGFSDEDFLNAGASAGDPWDAELVVKVKELQTPEYGKPRKGQTVFSFQHFGPEPPLLEAALGLLQLLDFDDKVSGPGVSAFCAGILIFPIRKT